MNALLLSTPSYLNEASLRNQLEANRNSELSELCRNDLIDEVPDFHLWLEVVRRIDEKR